MQSSIRFSGSCPTCGRHLHIPIELHGRLVRCHGCGADFRASGRRHAVGGPSEIVEEERAAQRSTLDSRVDSLLAAADRQLHLYPSHAALKT